MNPISTIPPAFVPSSQTAALLSAVGDPVAATFADLIDQLVLQSAHKNPGPSQAAIQAQEKIAEFRHKLALLTGMMEQAQIAMDAQKPLPGGLPTPAAEEYFFVKSELARVGLPGAIGDIV
ncbi:MAG TPA: hypothetical protein VJ873_13495 [bacterium]|nr:hypothetical protein [bacterium]